MVGLIDDAPNHLLPLEQALKIAQETCRGLEFAHSRCIVHRDLKPGNVWLTSDGIAKIGDFGLAVSLDRSRLTQEGMMVGTVSYMPPEQAMGGEVTPRSDLYSLGAMLYEMVTGRPPFLGDDSVAIIGQHINTPPVSPTWHNGQCPRPLDALIMRLLAKDPSERPDSATDVLSALDAIDFTESPSLETGDGRVSNPHALDSLAGGVFVGRRREMGELKAALEDVLSGRGRLVTLVGEPGIGKTRTALELATYAGLRQTQVLWGRCYEGEGAPPYWPWVQAIRSYVRDVDAEQLKSDMGAGAADIAEVVSDVREQLPGLQTPPQLEPEQARFRLFDSITAFLKSAGRRKPLVLVLHDLHWADHPSLLLLEFVARELASARVLVIGTYRDMELSRQHPLSHTLGELTRESLFQRVLLRGLDQEDVGRFVELASGVTPPTGLAAAVHRQTEGNPLFVTEVVRLLVQEGGLTQDSASERDSWSVRIPEGVRDVIGRRLDRLSERCNEILTIASVVGREFAIEQLSPLIEDISGDRLLEVMDEALSSRVIEELPQSVGRYQFTHALIQETLIGELPLTRRVRVHGRIAEALEELYGASAEAHSAELAYHFAQAESLLGTEKLVKYSLLAGEKALASYAYEEALAIFQRGLAAKAGQEMGAEAAALLFGQGRAQAATLPRIRFQEAVDTLTRAFDLYVAVGHISEALSVAEYQVFPTIGITQVNQLIGRALDLVHPDSLQAGRLLSRYGSALASETNNTLVATEALERALAIAQSQKDADLEMWTLTYMNRFDIQQMKNQDALSHGVRALDLARNLHDPFAERSARFHTVWALLTLGDTKEATNLAEPFIGLMESLRDQTWLENALLVNACLASLKGDWISATIHCDRILQGDQGSAAGLGHRTMLEISQGHYKSGDLYHQKLIEANRAAVPGPSLWFAIPAVVVPVAERAGAENLNIDIAYEAAHVVLNSSPPPVYEVLARAGLALIAIRNN